MKIKSLKLSYPHLDPVATKPGAPDNFGYRVLTVGDSVEFLPNQFLTRSEVEHLCNKGSWRVTVVGA